MLAPDSRTGPSVTRSAWRLWAALAVVAGLMNFIWELLEMALYEWPDTRVWSSTGMCAVATAGDVAITVGAYAAVALVTHDRWWSDRLTVSRLTSYVAVGLVVTIVLEICNVYVGHRWAYAPSMPLILGIGLAPLAQWVVVPPLTLLLARRAEGVSRREP